MRRFCLQNVESILGDTKRVLLLFHSSLRGGYQMLFICELQSYSKLLATLL